MHVTFMTDQNNMSAAVSCLQAVGFNRDCSVELKKVRVSKHQI